ncbi:MAG: alpha-amylase family glycosyl hydrolase, partial [Fidelibacterota bacterium]
MHQTGTTIKNPLIVYEIFPRNYSSKGDFKSIIQDLPRIHSLGVDVVWLMPIHPVGRAGKKGKTGSPYAVRDYFKIHDALGTVDEFIELVEKIHESDMKIILDMVFNHTSPDSDLYRRHPEWFYQNSEGLISTKVPEWSDVIDLDYTHSDMWEEQVNVLKFWTSTGVDGFRCDVAPMIPVEFWTFARDQVDPKHEQIWIAESVHLHFIQELRRSGFPCHSDPELHQVFDFTYDYDAFGFLENYFEGKSPLSRWIDYLNFQSSLYPHTARKFRFLENHDCPRIASRLDTIEQLMNWTMLMFLLPGANLVYAGQEFGMKHSPGLFEIDPIRWDTSNEGFYTFFKKVIQFIKKHKPHPHQFEIVQIRETLLSIKWSSNGDFVCYMNLSPEDCVFPSQYSISGHEIFSNRPVNFSV